MQVRQGLTPTRHGNVSGSLSTHKQAVRGTSIFIDASCFPSLYYTYTDLSDPYHQMQWPTAELPRGWAYQKMLFPICILASCLREGFLTRVLCKDGVRLKFQNTPRRISSQKTTSSLSEHRTEVHEVQCGCLALWYFVSHSGQNQV